VLAPSTTVEELLYLFANRPDPGHCYALIRIQDELSDLLGGYPVDLVIPKFLNHRIRDQVLSEAELVYEQ
jgi:predicted nucleotidyltransferase